MKIQRSYPLNVIPSVLLNSTAKRGKDTTSAYVNAVISTNGSLVTLVPEPTHGGHQVCRAAARLPKKWVWCLKTMSPAINLIKFKAAADCMTRQDTDLGFRPLFFGRTFNLTNQPLSKGTNIDRGCWNCGMHRIARFPGTQMG